MAETNLGMCSTHLVMTSAKFPEVCQEMSKTCFLEEDETFFYVWEFLEPRWCSRCDGIFSSSSFVELLGLETDSLDSHRVHGGSQLGPFYQKLRSESRA